MGGKGWEKRVQSRIQMDAKELKGEVCGLFSVSCGFVCEVSFM